jgi:hypothetical protein
MGCRQAFALTVSAATFGHGAATANDNFLSFFRALHRCLRQTVAPDLRTASVLGILGNAASLSGVLSDDGRITSGYRPDPLETIADRAARSGLAAASTAPIRSHNPMKSLACAPAPAASRAIGNLSKVSAMVKDRKWIEFPTAEYHAWHAMVRRCHDPSDASFPHYGGRGIHVCDRWRDDFESFLADMGLRPSGEHSLDRCDNDAGYTPENCRWATRSVQQRNRRAVLRAAGYTRNGKGWRAQIQINGRPIVLGNFGTKAEARSVYRQAAIQALILTELFMGALGPLIQNDRCANCGSPGARKLPAKISFDPPPPAPTATARRETELRG